MTVHIKLSSSSWNESRQGKLKKRGSCLQTIEGFLTAKTTSDVREQLAAQNGFYALIWQQCNVTYAAVDHVRSIPLFYGLKDQQFYLSDDADWVREKIGNIEMDPIAKEEFLLAGYVTGRDTLYPDVKQLQAGEFLVINNEGLAPNIHTERYYRFLHTEPKSYDEPLLRQRLEDVTLKAAQRLIEHAAGRQLVLPLSGGYDSRLIATMLKRLGYKNVLCFTYGVPGNKEAIYSKKVAESLGFDWAFVEYSASHWKLAWRTVEAEQYRRMASNHVSLPHAQDWLAIRELLSTGQITSSSVIVPGHSGDFVAGSHIPKFVFKSAKHSEESLHQTLVDQHLSNAPKNGMKLAEEKVMSERLSDRIRIPFDSSDVGFANLYELWDWQERQAKYIVNSVRVYDQFGLGWWMPLWDREFVKFWHDVPLTLRKERAWFNSWIDEQYNLLSRKVTSNAPLGNATDPSAQIRMLKFIFELLPRSLRKKLREIWHSKTASSHFLAFEGLVTEGEVNDYIVNGYNLIGIYSQLYIKNKW